MGFKVKSEEQEEKQEVREKLRFWECGARELRETNEDRKHKGEEAKHWKAHKKKYKAERRNELILYDLTTIDNKEESTDEGGKKPSSGNNEAPRNKQRTQMKTKIQTPEETYTRLQSENSTGLGNGRVDKKYLFLKIIM